MVQSFVIEETKELIYDNEKLVEWKEKCQELGLSKQLDLTSKEASPIPFECMNIVQRRVYETLCPAKVDFKQYSKTAIPLEVLGLIQLSQNENYFREIEIWYDDKAPDPLAVGIKQKSSQYDIEHYLIARWGDVLRDFNELKKMARDRYITMTRVTLQKKISEAKVKLENLVINSEDYFEGQGEFYDVSGFL